VSVVFEFFVPELVWQSMRRTVRMTDRQAQTQQILSYHRKRIVFESVPWRLMFFLVFAEIFFSGSRQGSQKIFVLAQGETACRRWRNTYGECPFWDGRQVCLS